MAHHGVASIAPTPPLARRSSPALLDTNRRFSQNNKSRNSFKTNTRAQNFSIQIEPLLDKKRSPARAPLTRRSRIRTSQRQISNRNTTSFKNPANLMKTNPKPKSNRNKNTIPPSLSLRTSRSRRRKTVLQPLRSKRGRRDAQPGQLASQLRASSWLENTSMVMFRFWATRAPNPSVVGSLPTMATLGFISRCLRYATTSIASVYLSKVESAPLTAKVFTRTLLTSFSFAAFQTPA